MNLENSNLKARRSEELAAKHLKRLGYKLLAKNWKGSGIEVDLVVKRKRTVYLVEVKYRGYATAGDGFSAIGANKLGRLKRAAEYWKLTDKKADNIGLLAVAMEGADFSKIDVIEVSF